MATAQPLPRRHELLTLLQGAGNSLQHCFALLFTYFPSGGNIAAVQDIIATTDVAELHKLPVGDFQSTRGKKFTPERLDPAAGIGGLNSPARAADIVHDLTLLLQYDEFEVQALRWLKRLDNDLAGLLPFDESTKLTVRGFDNDSYWVCRTNNSLTHAINDPDWNLDDDPKADPPKLFTWEGSQSPTLRAYCRKCTLIPQRTKPQFRLNPKSLGALANGTKAATRLTSDWTSRRLKVLIWPFRVPVEFDEQPEGATIALRKVVNEQAVIRDAVAAVEVARQEKATFLLFPELAISLATQTAIQDALRKHRSQDYPIVTIGGRVMCDTAEEEGTFCVNEAFLLGPTGDEIDSHRKLTSYQVGALREATDRLGNQVSVLESAMGNFTVLICLDLLHNELKAMIKETHYANLLMVPSLSPTTKAHMSSAEEFVHSSLASTFVCNHRLRHPSFPDSKPLHGHKLDDGASFWRVAHRSKDRRALIHPEEVEYFCFDLQDFREKLGRPG